MVAQNLGMKMLLFARSETLRTIVRMLKKIIMDYTVMSLTNPHTIRGRPTLKDVERFRNYEWVVPRILSFESVALKTLKEVNTSDVEKRKNLHEQNFDDEIKKNKQENRRKFNSPSTA